MIIARVLHRLFSRIGTPAMLLTFGFGLAIAQAGGWFAAGWLQVKLGLVFLLAVLHGVIAGQLRRSAADPAHVPPAWIGRLHFAIAALLLAIAVFAIVKP